MSDEGGRLVLAPERYRWTDRVAKITGVLLVAVGLELGGGTVEGIILGTVGAALALSTVFVEQATDSNGSSHNE